MPNQVINFLEKATIAQYLVKKEETTQETPSFNTIALMTQPKQLISWLIAKLKTPIFNQYKTK